MKKFLLISSLLASGVSMAQLPVSTTPENRNVVLEEYTGIYCTYCPDGHKLAQQYKDAHPNDVVLVNVHVGGYAAPSGGDPDFRTPFGTALANQSSLTGYPAGSVNRQVFASLAMDGGTAMSRSYWDDAGDQILAEQSYVNLAGEATLDVTTKELSVTVEYYYTGDSPQATNKLNIAVLMNNVQGPQTGADSFYPANILPNGKYNHQHMLRHFVTGQWGTDVTPTTTSSTGSITQTYTIPADLNGVDYQLGDLQIVAYMAEGQQSVETGVEVPLTLTNFPYQTDGNLTFADDISALCSGTSATIDPVIAVKNEGEQDITSMSISADVNGGTAVVTSWTGNIAFGQTEFITLDPITFNVLASNNLNVDITTVNGSADDVAANNTIVKSFSEAPTTGQYVKVTVNTDYYPGETGWTIYNDAMSVIATDSYTAGTADQWGGGGADANQTFEYNVDLGGAGCFIFEVTDSYGDGMIFNAGGSSTSSSAYGAHLETYGGTAVYDFVGNWGDDESGKFQSDASTQGASIEENELNAVLSIYPNPSTDITNVKVELKEAADMQIEIINALGQVVYVESANNLGAGTYTYQIDVNGFAKGFYTVKTTINGQVQTSKLSIR
ncbi:Omp28-related outer membrane protein [Paracrocinitomix mangrovi]|uniref:T9SS type A sorting domain-containing protein n=1 Tax=Paracrocinitomix mangrovi TaxID=2862509 RepID=UPI001C8DACD6|nr:Omp28-related outer membrane protein [Paracrocinitomix mangrovi]UKN00883.1 Omp28-related outer membrane protein [Paracrocinitomix mangrovi]